MKKRKQYRKNLLCAMIILCVMAGVTEIKAATNLTKVKQVSLGVRYSAAIKADNSLWTWGYNPYGQLGTGDTENSYRPVKIMEDVVSVSFGGNHSAAIKSDGSLWMWGVNTQGQLGTGDMVRSLLPVKIMEDVVSVSLGYSHSAAIKSDGSLWMWGKNTYGNLGNETRKESCVPIKIMEDVTAVSLGENHSAAIKSDGSLWMWGFNVYGNLGIGNRIDSDVPVKVMDDVKSVSLGNNHSAAVKINGSLWCWGAYGLGSGVVGNGDTLGSLVPVKILEDVEFVALGNDRSAAIKADGSLWTWGADIGNGNSAIGIIPIKILEGVAAVDGGGSHRAIIKDNGSLWMWGENTQGQLGISSATVTDPRLVIAPIYSIIYDANDGSEAPTMQTKECTRNLFLRVGEPTRKGYTFLGWSESATATTAEYQPEDIFTKEQDTVLYAVWEANDCAISYNANGGSNAPAGQSQKYGTNLKLSGSKPTRTGYTFLGWSEDQNAVSAAYQASGNYPVERDVTLYAVWKLNTYTVSYHANGGTNAPASQTKNYGTGMKLSSNIPIKTGYTFLGWSDNKAATDVTYQISGNYTEEKNITLYAVWKINQYTVSYHVNGGIGTIESQTRDYGTNLKLSSTIPVREGYNFLGWSETEKAETAAYISDEKYMVEKDVTLYAVWKVTTYKVTYKVNGGKSEIGEQVKKHNETLILTSEKPVKDGYVFLGWSADAESTAVNYQPNGKYTGNEDITLYAVWEKEKIIAQKQTISVKSNITKEYKKNSKFKLGATAKTKLTYKSTNKKVVTVSNKGVVTIKGYGSAKIKINAAATAYYKKASKTVKISIVPGKITGLKVSSSEQGKLMISWKNNKQMSGYEIQFSTSKKFAMGKTKRGTAPANSTWAKANSLKSGKTYYVRICGYKTVKGVQVYGLWSDVKKIKIK